VISSAYLGLGLIIIFSMNIGLFHKEILFNPSIALKYQTRVSVSANVKVVLSYLGPGIITRFRMNIGFTTQQKPSPSQTSDKGESVCQ